MWGNDEKEALKVTHPRQQLLLHIERSEEKLMTLH